MEETPPVTPPVASPTEAPINPLTPSSSFPETPQPNIFKTFFLFLLALILLAGIAFAYFQFGPTQINLPGFSPKPTPTPIPQLSSTPTPDETANWKTFVNTKYNYSLKYPTEWQPATCRYTSNGVETINPKEEKNIEFHYLGWNCPETDIPYGYLHISISNQKELPQPQSFGTGWQLSRPVQTEINGKVFTTYVDTKVEFGPGPEKITHYFWQNQNQVFEFTTFSEENNQIINQILSTFRFLD